MEIIIYDPNKLNKIIDNPITDYQFTFLNEYNDYISILEIYKYAPDPFSAKNICITKRKIITYIFK